MRIRSRCRSAAESSANAAPCFSTRRWSRPSSGVAKSSAGCVSRSRCSSSRFSRQARLSSHAANSLRQLWITRIVQRLAQGAMMGLPEVLGPDSEQGQAAFARKVGQHRRHAFLQEYIPVAGRPQEAVQPADILDPRGAGLAGNQRAENPEAGTQPAERYPHLVNAFHLPVQHRRSVGLGMAQARADDGDEGVFAAGVGGQRDRAGLDIGDGFRGHGNSGNRRRSQRPRNFQEMAGGKGRSASIGRVITPV